MLKNVTSSYHLMFSFHAITLLIDSLKGKVSVENVPKGDSSFSFLQGLLEKEIQCERPTMSFL